MLSDASASGSTEAPRLVARDLVVSYGDTVAVRAISFEVQHGEFVALLGPSGCGKTTTLRAIAGLERITSGRIVIDGAVVADGARHVPPERRDTNMVFQSYGVWPHMSVFANVAYGLKKRGLAREEIHERVMSILSAVGLAHAAERYGTELSGGQQQRVALARALATRSKLVLYDEPLSNLDTALRASVRKEIRDLHSALRTTSIYVTHDQAEALSMADRVLVMRDGVIEQSGTPREIYSSPASRFVAGFVGAMNIGAATAQEVAGDGSRAVVRVDEHPALELTLEGAPRLPGRAGEKGDVMFRPEAARLCAAEAAGASDPLAPNRWLGSLRSAMFVGPQIECEVCVGDWLVRAVVPGDSAVSVGQDLVFEIDPSKLVWLPSSDGASSPSDPDVGG